MTRCGILTIITFTLFGFSATAQDKNAVPPSAKKLDSVRHYTTQHTQLIPEIDGKLDDEAWQAIEWGGDNFRQTQPDKGAPASVNTRFKILYDAKNLYIAIKCFDPEPTKIARRMARRDSFEGDMVEVNIDSYFDKRTAFSFTASVSGVKGDEYVSNNGDNWDSSWDPIWYLQTSIDAEGWNAEFRIPLSQLRFTNKEELTWGLEISRIFFRKQEKSVWQYIPPDAGGWVHLFGELRGLKGIKPQKQLEIQPFIVAQTERSPKEEGNPYKTGKTNDMNYGVDAKIGLTSDITLDLTINPDFGQVEADPSQVNLTAFRLFFQERRPFFTEGKNTLNFPIGQGNNNIFYSRRIGRQPQAGVNTDPVADDGVPEYVKTTKNTTILGAAKVTGKNKNGFSWGILESVTQKEYAEIDSLGYKRKAPIEPMTNYFVARAQQDVHKGNTLIGGIITATNRKLDEPTLDVLHKSAYTGGVDFTHYWKSRKYYVSGKTVFSNVSGSTDAISHTQLASERYFQRPDNYHTEYDSTRTSLTGSGGQFSLGKKSGDIVGDLTMTWQSPEFELNDIGFLNQTDNVRQTLWVQYRVLQPKGITRYRRFNINEWRVYDFGKKLTESGYNVNAHTQFKNFWSIGSGVSLITHSVSNADLRGGPSIRYPGGVNVWGYVESDSRKKIFTSLSAEYYKANENAAVYRWLSLDVRFQPVNAFNILISGSVSRNENSMQWVDFSDEDGEPHYIVGKIDQTQVNVSVRFTHMITPNLSIQYWGQPFGSAGKYEQFKTITNSQASNYEDRFAHIPASQLTLDDSGDTYTVMNGNGMYGYSFQNPNFNFGQFRSNMVVRWEYIPGSTVFLVWTQEKNGSFYDDVAGHKKYSLDFPDKGQNIFLLKFTYRLVL